MWSLLLYRWANVINKPQAPYFYETAQIPILDIDTTGFVTTAYLSLHTHSLGW